MSSSYQAYTQDVRNNNVAIGKPVVSGGVFGGPAFPYRSNPTFLDSSPHAGSLKCFTILLGLLGILQIFSVQGLLAVCCLCYVGCCCGEPQRITRNATCIKCCSMVAVLFAAVYCAGAIVLTQQVCDRLCGLVVLNTETPTGAAAWNTDELLLTNALAAFNGTDAYLTTGASGKSRWMIVHPWEVCDGLNVEEVASDGVFFPHPLAKFGKIIEYYLLAVNGSTVVVGILVNIFASKVLASQRTMPLERVSMGVFAP